MSNSDVLELLNGETAASRIRVTQKICEGYLSQIYNEEEIKLAEEIFRIIVQDVEVQVRAAMSEALKISDILPHDIAMKLAKDVEEVAIPMIEFSQVLSDMDIIEIIETSNPIKILAVTRRENITSKVKEKLLEFGNNEIIESLISNDNFAQDDESFSEFVDNIAHNSDAVKNLVQNITLPSAITEKLMSGISESLINKIKSKYDIAPNKLNKITSHSIEISILTTISSKSLSMEIDGLVNHLDHFDKLTPSLILSSLCMGRRRFFVSALAKKAGIPRANAMRLLYKGGKEGINGLLKKAGMPEKLFDAIELVMLLAEEKKREDKDISVIDFCTWLITKLEYFSERRNIDYLSYIMAIVKQSQKTSSQQAV